MSKFSVSAATATWAEKAQLEFELFREIESTNDTAKEQALKTKSGLKFYIADSQTHGRGRGSNTWDSGPAGDNLMMSFSYHLSTAPQPQMTPLLGLAVYRACSASFPNLSFSLKAPNDIYLDDKKIAGLLTEIVSTANNFRLVVGIGLNVFHAPLTTSTCLSNHTRYFTLNEWANFMDRLLLELTMVVASSPREIPPHQAEILKFAMNRLPHLKDKIESISPEGDIVTPTKTVKWSDL